MSEPPDARTPHITLCGGTRLTKFLEPGVPFTIGQSRTAALRIPHPAVADIHCTVTWEDGQVVLHDNGSPAGTSVNGWPLTCDVLLTDGDQITAGLFQLLFTWKKDQPEEPAAVADDPAPAPPPPDSTTPGFPSFNPSAGDGMTAAATTLPAADQPAAGALTVSFRGQAVSAVPLYAGLTLGCGDKADVKLQDPVLSEIQAVIEAAPDGFIVVDQGRTGSLVNGKFYDQHPLIIGDLLQFGERCFFVFDGFALRPVRDSLGCGIQAWGLEVSGGGRRGPILQGAGVDVRPGQFVGIIGPSGAGKTTLLRALLGFKPVTAGTILLDGQDLRKITDPSRFFGYVPQQEIVHLELTGRQALHYSALLRLPKRTPRREMDKLIHALSARLGLQQHLDTRAGRLSGGQLKRLSVCVELLSRPPLLFLDEPTSGLDPESETELMQQLQELSYTGCTVVCTTHLMENVYLMSSLEVIMAGRDTEGRPTPGRTVFRGKPVLAREIFGVKSLTKLYARLKESSPEEWQRLYQAKTGKSLTDVPEHSCGTPRTEASSRREKRRAAVPVLLARQWQILKSDWKNLLLLLGQPLLIATLIALVATGEDPSDKKLFLASIAILWLGCGNAAPELVRERSIFRREQFTGLRASSYLFSKFTALGILTAIQALLIFVILNFTGGGLDGSAVWQFSGFMAAAGAATGLGLAVSAWARTTLQAVLLVPVIIIPQILFAGFVFPVKDWDTHTIPRVASRLFPSFAVQRVTDVSLLWDKPVGEAATYMTALNNLTTSLRPLPVLLRPDQPVSITLDESKIYAPPEGWEPFGERVFEWDPAKRNILTPRYMVPTMRDERPRIFRHAAPAWSGLASLLAWTLLSAAAALLLLWKKDKE